MKRFDDTPNTSLKTMEERVLCNDESEKDECNEHYIHYIHSSALRSRIKLARKTQPKVRLALDVRATLYRNFRQIAARVDARRPVVELIEAFMEQYVRVFGPMANAQVTLFHPIPAGFEGENVYARARVKKLAMQLEFCIRILKNTPEDRITLEKLCDLLERNERLIESCEDPELQRLVKEAEAYL